MASAIRLTSGPHSFSQCEGRLLVVEGGGLVAEDERQHDLGITHDRESPGKKRNWDTKHARQPEGPTGRFEERTCPRVAVGAVTLPFGKADRSRRRWLSNWISGPQADQCPTLGGERLSSK